MMSKDFFGKKKVSNVNAKNEIKYIEKPISNNNPLLNEFLKKKGAKLQVLQKKNLPKLRKAFTPEIIKHKAQALNTINTQKHYEKEMKARVNKTLETIAVASKNGRNNSLLSIFNSNNKQIRTLINRSNSNDSQNSYSSVKKQNNLTFANAINNTERKKSNSVNHEKIKIIDNMIDGLQKLKTLVIEEDGKSRNYSKPNSENDSLKSQRRKESFNSNELYLQPYKNKVDKTMLEISKILETDNENETPKEKPFQEKINLNKAHPSNKDNLNLSSISKSKHSNFFKNVIKKDSPITILNNFTDNVKLLTKNLMPDSNFSLSHIRSFNDNSFLSSNPKIERANAYTSSENNNLFNNSLTKQNSNIVFKVIDKARYKQIRLDKSIELSKDQNNSAISFKTNKFRIKEMLNSNGNQTNISTNSRPISYINKSFNLNEEKDNKRQIDNTLLESNDKIDKIIVEECIKNNSGKSFSKESEENEITNYFKASVYNIEKNNYIESTKNSNGAICEIGKYMKKLNYFDESDGIMRNDEFID